MSGEPDPPFLAKISADSSAFIQEADEIGLLTVLLQAQRGNCSLRPFASTKILRKLSNFPQNSGNQFDVKDSMVIAISKDRVAALDCHLRLCLIPVSLKHSFHELLLDET